MLPRQISVDTEHLLQQLMKNYYLDHFENANYYQPIHIQTILTKTMHLHAYTGHPVLIFSSVKHKTTFKNLFDVKKIL